VADPARPAGQRVLITGLSSFWGGRIAQALESDPSAEVIVGLDTTEPTVQLDRTEFIRTDESYSILTRLIQATEVDTVVHAGLAVDSTRIGRRDLHERNVIGTMNLLAAMGTDDSPVRTVIVKSSTLVYGASPRDPAWFSESSRRTGRARTPIERSLVEAETYLHDFAIDRAGSVSVGVLRCANVLGAHITTAMSKALSLPLVPKVAGFDPQFQVVEENDVVRAVCFAIQRRLTGIFNVAGDGRLPWSEILAIAGKRPLLLPPVLTASAADPLARMRLVDLPPELLDLLRYGRGVDNRRLKEAGFRYRYTTGGAVEHFVEANRLPRPIRSTESTYRYDSDVEAFFRHSEAVVRDR
jgi:UDP-glucose 4-epimerase